MKSAKWWTELFAKGILLLILVSVIGSGYAKDSFNAFMDSANATMDAMRETREQDEAPENIRSIFMEARATEENDSNINFCGFYVGMSSSDAKSLADWYNLKTDEWSVAGDPVYEIALTLKGVRRVTKGGDTFDELAQAVANRVGNLQHRGGWDEPESYERKTIDGLVVTISETNGFRLLSLSAKAAVQAKEKAERDAAAMRAARVRQQAEAQRQKEREEAEARAMEAAKVRAIPDLIDGLVQIPGTTYLMGKMEVTQAQWEAIMGANPSKFKGHNRPVENISVLDCLEFLDALNKAPEISEAWLFFRLPTKDEWEYAFHAGAEGEYCILADGTEITDRNMLYRIAQFNLSETRPVGQKEPNAYGLYDMLGNVAEFTIPELGRNYWVMGGCWKDSAWTSFEHRCQVNEYWPNDERSGFRVLCQADSNAVAVVREKVWEHLIEECENNSIVLEGIQEKKASIVAEKEKRREEAARLKAEKQKQEERAARIKAKWASIREAFDRGGEKAGETKKFPLSKEQYMEMVWCPAGSFTQGSPGGLFHGESGRSDDEAEHVVTFSKGFWMAKTEVTQAQWQSVMGLAFVGHRGDQLPIENVSWDECQAFCQKIATISGLEVRLPTEAEWEYACRAGNGGAYSGTGNLADMGWYQENSENAPHPVGEKTANAWGLYDMHGNVGEWCIDWYGVYPAKAIDPTGATSGKYRITRGGDYGDQARYCRSASRNQAEPLGRNMSTGFRPVICQQ